MYLLFVDESGTHGGSNSFVLGGMAVHEADAIRLQKELDQLVIQHLGSAPVNLEDYELHATELRNARKPKANSKARASVWANEDRAVRLDLLNAAYQLLANFEPADSSQPLAFFGVVVDTQFHPDWAGIEREQWAYEVLLNKFDVMLKNTRAEVGQDDKGLVIHDRRVIAERDIQTWTSEWRVAAGRVGQLRNLADVPLFADSRASRLLQAADLLAYSLYRRYQNGNPDPQYFSQIWPTFEEGSRELHNCAHFTPSYGSGCCLCEPCSARMKIEAAKSARPSKSRASAKRGRNNRKKAL